MTPSDAYGVVKPARVQAALARQPAEQRGLVEDALAGLSADPRPPASRPAGLALAGQAVLELPIEVGAARCRVAYAVDDQARRVTVLTLEWEFE